MKFSINQSMQQKQTLTMTQSLKQSLHLLQVNQMDLQQEIDNFLNSNIMLEMDESSDEISDPFENVSSEETINHPSNTSSELNTETLDWKVSEVSNHEDFEFDDHAIASSTPYHESEDLNPLEDIHQMAESLHDFLLAQCQFTNFTPVDQMIAEYIIDNIDENGYLSVSTDKIYRELQPQIPELLPLEIEAVLHQIQHFDPPGVGARDITECLILQIQQMSPRPDWEKLAYRILTLAKEALLRLDIASICRIVKEEEAKVREILKQLKALNPKPGQLFNHDNEIFFPPDIFVEIKHQHLNVRLNPNIIPKLKINKDYSNMVKVTKEVSKDEVDVLKQHLTEARSFIKALDSRFDTLLRVATEIVNYQSEFFFKGELAIRPLQLKTIANILGIHESTVSRAVAGKTLFCAHGVYELKFFFSNTMPGQVNKYTGEDTADSSSAAIRAEIRKIIDSERKEKPLSDAKLALLLKAKGYPISRRTVAKYREILGILSSSERKIFS